MTKTKSHIRAPRRPIGVDVYLGSVSFDGTTYSLSDLDDNTVRALALVGLRHRLVLAHSHSEEFSNLAAGNIRIYNFHVSPLSSWEQAIVAAIVEASKDCVSPHSHGEAVDMMRKMSRERKAECRKDPDVVRHYCRITGKNSSILEIVNADVDIHSPDKE